MKHSTFLQDRPSRRSELTSMLTRTFGAIALAGLVTAAPISLRAESPLRFRVAITSSRIFRGSQQSQRGEGGLGARQFFRPVILAAVGNRRRQNRRPPSRSSRTFSHSREFPLTISWGPWASCRQRSRRASLAPQDTRRCWPPRRPPPRSWAAGRRPAAHVPRPVLDSDLRQGDRKHPLHPARRKEPGDAIPARA